MPMSSTMTEHSPPIKINAGKCVHAVTFSANGEYLLSCVRDQYVGVWRVQDGKRVAMMATGVQGDVDEVLCLAVSKDGQWIAAGTFWGKVVVWDAETRDKVWEHKQDSKDIRAVDFSPDSTRLVSASDNYTATVWDIATRKQIQTLKHKNWVFAAKFSPKGDRIPVTVTPEFNNGLLWDHNNLVVTSRDKIKHLDPSTGSTSFEWSIPGSNTKSCISVPKCDGFIALSTNSTVTLLDTTQSRHSVIQHTGRISSLALSPDDRSLAIGGKDGIIIIRSLPRIADSLPFCSLHPTLQEPDIRVNDAVLNAWKHDQLESAEALLATAIQESQNPIHNLLAARALVRARLQHWDEALADANKGVAHVGKGEKDTAYRTCDIAFEHFHSSHVTFLLLIKAIIVSMAGEHPDAISRLDDLIATLPSNSAFYVIQAYMYFLQGNTYMERSNYESAIHSFERARKQLRHCRNRPPLVISLLC
ncbi:WD40-repeat-containing domain protein [Tylopilus felleus]